MVFEDLTFIPMTEADIPTLTPVMKRAFDDDSKLFFLNPVGGPPGYDDGSFLRKWGLESGAAAYRISLDDRPIGAIILFIDKAHSRGFLGCLFIDADLIGKGYGTKAWHFAEHTYPDVRVWETETPAVSFRNHRFYVNKCGFQVYAVDGDQRYEAQFKLRKLMRDEAPAVST